MPTLPLSRNKPLEPGMKPTDPPHYQSGKIEGTDIPVTLTLNSGNEIIKIEDMLKEIEKYWDSKIS